MDAVCGLGPSFNDMRILSQATVHEPFLIETYGPMATALASSGSRARALEAGKAAGAKYARAADRIAARKNVSPAQSHKLAVLHSQLLMLQSLFGKDHASGSIAAVEEMFDGKAAPRGEDGTPEFEAAMSDVRDGLLTPAELKALRGYHFILVGGLTSDAITEKARSLKIPPLYFGGWIDLLRSNKITVTVARINTQRTSSENAPDLAKLILKSRKPVILVGHSMGAVYARAALLEILYRHGARFLSQKIGGAAFFQGPLKGDKTAQALLARPGKRRLLAERLEVRGGSIDLLRELTPAYSRKYSEVHGAGLAQLVASVPIITFGSWMEKSYLPLLKPFVDNSIADAVGESLARLLPINGAATLPLLLLQASKDSLFSPEPTDALVGLESTSMRGAKRVVMQGNHLELFGPAALEYPLELARSILGPATKFVSQMTDALFPLAPSLSVSPRKVTLAAIRMLLAYRR